MSKRIAGKEFGQSVSYVLLQLMKRSERRSAQLDDQYQCSTLQQTRDTGQLYNSSNDVRAKESSGACQLRCVVSHVVPFPVDDNQCPFTFTPSRYTG